MTAFASESTLLSESASPDAPGSRALPGSPTLPDSTALPEYPVLSVHASGESPLEMSAQRDESGTVVVHARGCIERTSAAAFKKAVHDEVRARARVVVLELSEVSFLSLDGVHALATLRQTARLNRARLLWRTGGNPPVQRALRAASLAAAETLASYRTPHIPAQGGIA